MRRPGARPGQRLAGIDVHPAVVDKVGIGDHRVRAVEVELHVRVGNGGLDPLRPQVRVGAGDVAVVGLLHGLHSGGLALLVIGVEEPRAGLAAQHIGQLPGQVVGVLDARVAAEAAGGGHGVGRVSGDEDAAPLEGLRGAADCDPARHVLHPDVEPRLSDRVADQLSGAFGRDPVGGVARGRIVDVAHGEDHQEAAHPGLFEPEEAPDLRVVDVDDPQVAAAERPRAVGPEVDGDAVRQHRRTAHRDPEPLADRAAVAVAGDHVAGADPRLGLAVDVAQHRGDPRVVLVEVDQLGGVAELRAQLGRPLLENGFEHLLGHEQPPRRADVLHPLVDVGDVVGDLAPGQGLDRVHAPIGIVQGMGGGDHPILDAGDPHELERPQLEIAGARVDGGAAVLFHVEARRAVKAQEHGGGEPDEAAADHQNGSLDGVRHTLVLSAAGSSSGWCRNRIQLHRGRIGRFETRRSVSRRGGLRTARPRWSSRPSGRRSPPRPRTPATTGRQSGRPPGWGWRCSSRARCAR